MTRRTSKPLILSTSIEPSQSSWNWTEFLIVSLILVGGFALRWPFRNVGMIRDEGEYAHLGQEILHGGVPYRDIYNQKTPFAFFFFAAVQSILGREVVILRITTILY